MQSKPEPANLPDRVEVRPAPAVQPGNVIPALARLLRRLRDRQRDEARRRVG